MSKTLRNTIFTVAVLILVAIGLSWTRRVTLQTNPAQISDTVLSAATGGKQAFPLKLEFAQSRVKLGQYQEINVTTLPGTKLQIVTIYPNGSINNPQTLRAVTDETGRYSLKFKLDDFAYLGVFQTRILATTANGQESETSGRFVLQSWGQSNQVLGGNFYVYPLLP